MKRLFAALALGLAVSFTPAFASAQDSVKQVLAKYNNEPTAAETIQAALDFAGLDSDRLESMYSRAGAAKALPKELSYQFDYQDTDQDDTQLQKYGQTVTKSKTGTTDSNKWDETDDTTRKVETEKGSDKIAMKHSVKAKWELSGLVFNKEQLDVYKTMVSSSSSRDKLIKVVSNAYFKRRTLQIQMDTDPTDDVMERLQQELDLQQATAELDAMTGGWFSKHCR